MLMLCRNRVEDYEHWRTIFDANLDGPAGAGLALAKMWRDVDDPQVVFFTFKVADKDKALAFLQDPASAQKGVEARVVDGECFFLEEVK